MEVIGDIFGIKFNVLLKQIFMHSHQKDRYRTQSKSLSYELIRLRIPNQNQHKLTTHHIQHTFTNMMVGGHSEPKEATDVIKDIATSLKAAVEGKLEKSFSKFDAIHYTEQVVSGMVFHIAVETGDGEAVHLRCYQPLPHTGDPVTLQACKLATVGETLSIMKPEK